MAVTAYAAKGDEERIRDAGAEGYVSKPISVLRFVEAVAGLLDAAALRDTAPAAEAEPEPSDQVELEAAATASEVEDDCRTAGDAEAMADDAEAAPKRSS